MSEHDPELVFLCDHADVAGLVPVCFRVRDAAVPELPHRGRPGVPGGRVALAGQPAHQGHRSRVRSVGVESQLAADRRPLRPGQRLQQVGASLIDLKEAFQ